MTAGENPFRSARVTGLGFCWPEGGSMAVLMAEWRSAGCRGAVAGAKGNGKSTLLREWMAALAEEGWVCWALRLTEESPRLPRKLAPPVGSDGRPVCAVLDGAEQMGWVDRRRWRRAVRRLQGEIQTCHDPRGARLPVLWTLQAGPAQVEHLLGQLLGGARGRVPESAAELLAAHQGDVRQLLRSLYDRAAGW